MAPLLSQERKKSFCSLAPPGGHRYFKILIFELPYIHIKYHNGEVMDDITSCDSQPTCRCFGYSIFFFNFPPTQHHFRPSIVYTNCIKMLIIWFFISYQNDFLTGNDAWDVLVRLRRCSVFSVNFLSCNG